MRPLTAVLQDLLIAAEYVVARPLAGAMALDRTARLKDIAVEMRRHHEMPSEFTRATHGGIGLVLAMEAYWRAQDDRNATLASLWIGCVGLMLPIVRIEADIAMKNERQAKA